MFNLKFLFSPFIDYDKKTWSHTKTLSIIASLVFTRYMVMESPSDWELWATYMGCVGGYSIMRKAISQRMSFSRETGNHYDSSSL